MCARLSENAPQTPSEVFITGRSYSRKLSCNASQTYNPSVQCTIPAALCNNLGLSCHTGSGRVRDDALRHLHGLDSSTFGHRHWYA